MASIYKRGKVWWVHYTDEFGKRACASLKTRDKTVARRLVKQYEIEERQRALRGDATMAPVSLGAYCTEYLHARKKQVAPKTLARYKQAMQSLQKHTGDISIHRIRPTDIENWRATVLDTRATATANCLLRHVKAAFAYAVEHRYLTESPTRYVRSVRETTKPLRILSRDEARQLTDKLPPAWETLVRAALYTGARSGELCRLIPADVDLTVPSLTIRSTPSAPTKSKKTRVVPLPEQSIQFFSALLERTKPGQVLLRSPKGFQWRVVLIAGRFPRWAEKCGVTGCTFHDLRRTYGAWLVMAGADLVTVQQNLGHSDISVTVKHYAHMVFDHRKEQVNRLPVI